MPKCPLLLAACLASPLDAGLDADNCREDGCVWWEVGFGCSVPLTNYHLSRLGDNLNAIVLELNNLNGNLLKMR